MTSLEIRTVCDCRPDAAGIAGGIWRLVPANEIVTGQQQKSYCGALGRLRRGTRSSILGNTPISRVWSEPTDFAHDSTPRIRRSA